MEILSFLLYIILFSLRYHTGFSLLNNNTIIHHLCHQDESQLLLQLKQQLHPPQLHSKKKTISYGALYSMYSKTMSWNQSSDCCRWDGVTCDESTGHVIGVDLSSDVLTGKLDSNSTLFRLPHLRKLNLAFNHFGGSEISFKFGRLNRLTHLNLSFSGFGGQIAPEFYYLSNLVSLDLSRNPDLNCDIKMLLGNMTKIRVLLLQEINISSELPMNMSSFLTHLNLSASGIYGKLPVSIFEKPNLQVLRLSGNGGLKISWPKSLNQSNVRSLKELELSGTIISGRLPESIGFMNNLNYVGLSSCELWGPIPESIGNITEITEIYMSGNNFSSQVPSTISNLHHLTDLDLSWNHLVGIIPSSLTNMSQLESLDISSNALTGPFPSVAGDGLQKLFYMDFSNNSIQGMIPSWLLSLPSLERLHLNFNKLSGQIRTFNCSRLASLDLSRNHLVGIIPSSLTNMSQLESLDISSNALTGPFPSVAGDGLQKLFYMDFSNNSIQGMIPSWLLSLPSLERLHLNFNKLSGQIRTFNCSRLASLDLSRNHLVGIIPSSLTNMSQLESLDISSNALTGPFPSVAGDGLQKLFYMDFSNNSIQGMIPSWLLSLPSLERLDLNFNKLSGQIRTFNCSRLASLDLSYNQLNIELKSFYNLGNIEFLLAYNNTVTEHAPEIVNTTLPNLQHLDLSSCAIKKFPAFLRNSPSLRWLDLSDNKIHGPIPSWFSSITWQSLSYISLSNNALTHTEYLPWQRLENLQYLNLRSNSLQESFPSSICNLTNLYVLDLSNNKLKGKIPECIGNSSTSLRVLDLRRNQLRGKIPTTIGNADNHFGNLGLNGNHLEGPLPRSLANCIELEILDLGNNMIHDTFPLWLGTLPQLKILILKSNSFYGPIMSPVSDNSFSQLHIVDLSHNYLTGILSENFFARFEAMKNQDQPSIDFFPFGSDHSGSSTYQYSVTLLVKGVEVEFNRTLNILTTIDLSSNNFHGCIPESLAYLNSLRLLNLSHNSINGGIPPALGHMAKLEQLDLSSNQLTGGIPQTLTNLTFLAVLNLSHNQLVGPIPQANQFLTFSNESYIGDSGLCGAPLTKQCGDNKATSSQEEDDSGFMMGFTWKAVVMGYGCGVVFGFIIGNVMISTGKPIWLARFVKAEAANYLNGRKKRGRMVQGRR